MASLPPPPPPPVPAPLAQFEPVLETPEPPQMVSDLTPGQLTSGWRTVATVSWLGAVIALFASSDIADFIGKPTWWQLHGLVFVPFILPLIAGAVAYVNLRRTLSVSLLGAISIGVSAIVTRGAAPGAALVEAAIAVAMLLLTAACYAGRVVATPALDPAP